MIRQVWVIYLSAIVAVGYEVALTGELFGEIAQELHCPRVIKEVDDPNFEAKPRHVGIFDEVLNIAYSQTDEQVA